MCHTGNAEGNGREGRTVWRLARSLVEIKQGLSFHRSQEEEIELFCSNSGKRTETFFRRAEGRVCA